MVIATVFCTLALLCCAPLAWGRDAEGVDVSARVSSERVFVGETVRLHVSVRGSRTPAPPDLSGISGFEVRSLGGQDVSRSFTSIVNGRRTDEVFSGFIFTYDLIPTGPGQRVIPAIEVQVDGATLRTEPIAISILRPQDDPDVKLRLEVDNPNPFEGEPVTLRVVWGVLREPSGPHFVVPGIEGAFDVVGPSRPAMQEDLVVQILGVDAPLLRGQEVFDGQQYFTFTAEIILTPRRAGELRIGPATVSCSILVRRGRGFFDQDENRRAGAESNGLVIHVKPLPTDGRPPNFTGLVGRYSLGASATPTEVNVGDPITLRLRVLGPMAGSAPAPALSKQGDLSRDFRIAEEAGPVTASRQTKEWSRTLRALRDDVTQVPPIELPYFDPLTQRFEIARSEPIPLTVRPTRIVTAADAEGGLSAPAEGPGVEDVASGIRHSYTGATLLIDQSFDLRRALVSPMGVVAVAAPPLAYTGVGMILLVRRLKGGRESARRRRRRALSVALEALGGPEPDRLAADSVSSALRGYIADCFDKSAGVLTALECAELVARVSPLSAESVRLLLDRCDAARFGAAGAEADRRLRDEAEALLRELSRAGVGGGG